MKDKILYPILGALFLFIIEAFIYNMPSFIDTLAGNKYTVKYINSNKFYRILYLYMPMKMITQTGFWKSAENADVYQVIELKNNYENKKAQDIMYKYLKSKHDKLVKDYKEGKSAGDPCSDVPVTFDTIYVAEADLNNDGVNEIIGTSTHVYFTTKFGSGIYILQKNGDEYINISRVNAFFYVPIKILKTKTDDYRDIKPYSVSEAYSSVSTVAKYVKEKNKYYTVDDRFNYWNYEDKS